MKLSYLAVFASCILIARAEDGPPNHADPRIVGGTLVRDRREFPYQVSIRLKQNNFHFCGGSVLDSQHVITATHCAYDNNGKLVPPSSMVVVVGDLNIATTNNSTVRRDVKNVFTHEKYSKSTIENDIAVFRIDGSFPSNPYVTPISLTSALPKPYVRCTVSGWGKLNENHTSSPKDLYKADVPIMTEKECKDSYGKEIKSGMFCAGYKTGQIDACQGDSGGPLACGGELAGIVSWGYGCAKQNYPGVYTDVSRYKDWIKTQQKRSSSNSIEYSGTLMAILTIFSLFTCKISIHYKNN